MKDILCVKDWVRDWYNRNRFIYILKFGKISELDVDMNELDNILHSGFKIKRGKQI